MSVFDKFPDEQVVTVVVKADGPATKAKPSVNGASIEIENNTPTPIPACFADVLRNAGYDIEILDGPSTVEDAPEPVGGDGDGAGAGEGSDTDPGPVTEFDPEAIIAGNVQDVVVVLDTLTVEQLHVLDKAEEDREKPRVGVRSAIADAIKSKEGGA